MSIKYTETNREVDQKKLFSKCMFVKLKIKMICGSNNKRVLYFNPDHTSFNTGFTHLTLQVKLINRLVCHAK